MAERKQVLEQKYGSDAALGVAYDPEQEASILPNGDEVVRCTNYAKWIVEQEGAGFVVGYPDKGNPTQQATGDFPGTGHDFAIIDNRFIVDPWVVEVSGASARAVLDMLDPTDQLEIARLYGDPRTWEPIVLGPTRGNHDGRTLRKLWQENDSRL